MVTPEETGGVDDLQEENTRLRAAVQELSILNDISTAISSTRSLEEVIELIVKKCIKHLEAEQGTVTLLDQQEQETPFKTMIRKADRSSNIMPYHFDTQLTGWMLLNRKPLLVNDLKNDDRFTESGSQDNPVKSLLSAPLILKGRVIGSLNVFNKRSDKGFSEADKRLLSIIASQSAQVIENARLYEEEQSLIHLREEMDMAYRIQTGLLPKEPPKIDGYDIAGKSIPARTVGGDYFDFIELDDGRVLVCLGDVSGKGMPAALLMSNLQATLRGQDLHSLCPSEIVERSNSLLFRSTAPDKFATFFLCSLDAENDELCYCNAGHNYPFMIRNNAEHARLATGGLVLGALEEYSFSQETLKLDRGDTILVFSDGISEANNENGEEFGEDILPALVREKAGAPSEELIDFIISSVERHAGKLPRMDDMTVVVIRKL